MIGSSPAMMAATVIIFGRTRSTLGAFHRRRIMLVPDEAFHRVEEVALVSAAEFTLSPAFNVSNMFGSGAAKTMVMPSSISSLESIHPRL
jgi:hypothetical protein